MGGCVWSLIPMVFLIVLYAIIREPLVYMMNVPSDMIKTVSEITGVANSGAIPRSPCSGPERPRHPGGREDRPGRRRQGRLCHGLQLPGP